MILVYFFTTKDGDLLGFEISGHAEIEEEGERENIQCAAVSSAVYMAVNTITDVICANADVTEDDLGLMVLRINLNEAYRCREILLGLKIHLLNLEEQYPDRINVNYTEV